MNCKDFDVRDYVFGEISEAARPSVARHVAGCSNCSGEVDRLKHLRLALESLPDEEPPQRIGFVSDKIFEPSRARRLWNAFWQSGPRLGFAPAAMVSAALVFFAVHPAQRDVVRIVEKQIPTPVVASSTAIQPLIDQAVRKAVAVTEQRTDMLLTAERQRHDRQEKQLILTFADSFDKLQRRATLTRASMMTYGGEAQ